MLTGLGVNVVGLPLHWRYEVGGSQLGARKSEPVGEIIKEGEKKAGNVAVT